MNKIIFEDPFAAIKKYPQKTIVRWGFRARKGQVTEKPETDAYILKLRRHWISCGTVF